MAAPRPRWRSPALAALAALALAACAGARSPSAPPSESSAAVHILDENPAPTDIHDLELLRRRATMGHLDEVREAIAPRLASASKTAPDAGRDALRRLSIEMALTQGDARTAATQLTLLERDVGRLGPAASPEERAIVALLYSDLAFRANHLGDARTWSLRALSLLEGSASPLLGDARRVLARNLLALGNPTQALELVEQARTELRQSREAEEGDRQELLLLRVDILLALHFVDEAVIAASDAYDGAIEHFGGDSLPHAEALLAVAAATYAAGSLDAAASMFVDARVIFDDLQAARPASASFPVSERLALRIEQLAALMPAGPSGDDSSE